MSPKKLIKWKFVTFEVIEIPTTSQTTHFQGDCVGKNELVKYVSEHLVAVFFSLVYFKMDLALSTC